MLSEQASSSQIQPTYQREDTHFRPDPYSDLRDLIMQWMVVSHEVMPEGDYMGDDILLMSPHHAHLISFEGKLTGDSEAAYNAIDAALEPHDRFVLFRRNLNDSANPHTIHILQRRVQPIEGRPWVNALLFVLTALSVMWAGASYGLAGIDDPERLAALSRELLFQGEVVAIVPRLTALWLGYPYALTLLLILGAHELGHYFAARYHKHGVSLPYFIPLPFVGLGTMGAVIRSREPMRNRKVLFDVGAAGPLAGLVFAIPLVIYGLSTSQVEMISGAGLREGNSIIYALAKIIALGSMYPTATHDVTINQVAFAGWLGLLVTALNLIPVGQLDGGHVLYSLLGERAKRAYIPVMLAMVLLTALSQMWLIWVFLLLLLGRLYAPPLDDITPLDTGRRWLAIATLAIFVLVFVPRPFTPVELDGDPVPQTTVQAQPHAPELSPFGVTEP